MSREYICLFGGVFVCSGDMFICSGDMFVCSGDVCSGDMLKYIQGIVLSVQGYVCSGGIFCLFRGCV